jgi:sugar phosphate permease
VLNFIPPPLLLLLPLPLLPPASIAAGLFFCAYASMQVPANMVMAKIGGPIWLGTIGMLWGITAACFASLRSVPQFLALRFLLGVFEAGALPSMWSYLSHFYSRQRITVPLGEWIHSNGGTAQLAQHSQNWQVQGSMHVERLFGYIISWAAWARMLMMLHQPTPTALCHKNLLGAEHEDVLRSKFPRLVLRLLLICVACECLRQHYCMPIT